MALEHQLLTHRAELDRMTRLDALTGLANRREYLSVLAWAWNNARRSQSPLALLVVDLDHFKTVNDRHGHTGGDACLKHVASTLQAQFQRSTDLVARTTIETPKPDSVALDPTGAEEAFQRVQPG